MPDKTQYSKPLPITAITIFTRMQDEVFPLKLALNYLKFAYEAPNRTEANWIALNRTMQSQTKACITQSCKICAHLRHYSV